MMFVNFESLAHTDVAFSFIVLNTKGASHYGLRSRGHRFPPIILQEIKMLEPSTLHTKAKVQRPLEFKRIVF